MFKVKTNFGIVNISAIYFRKKRKLEKNIITVALSKGCLILLTFNGKFPYAHNIMIRVSLHFRFNQRSPFV